MFSPRKTRLFAVALVAALALSLAGCSSARSSADGENSAANSASGCVPTDNVPIGAPSAVGTLHLLANTTGGGTGTNTGEAYYEYIRTDAFMQARILKTDYATAEQTCICQKAGCAHADESCNAFLPDWSRLSLYAENDLLYLAYSGIADNETTPEQQKEIDAENARISEMLPTQEERDAYDRFVEISKKTYAQNSYIDVLMPDASERRRIAEFPKDVNPIFYATEGAYLYGLSQSEKMFWNGERYDFPVEACIWVNLATGEYGIRSLEGLSTYKGIYENTFVFETLVSDQDLQALRDGGNQEALAAAMQKAALRYDSVNPVTGERKTLATVQGTQIKDSFIAGGTLYYQTYKLSDTFEILQDGIIYAVNLTTAKETPLPETLDTDFAITTVGSFVEEGYGTVNGKGKYLSAALVLPQSNSGLGHSAMVNLETGEIIKNTLSAVQPTYGFNRIFPVAQTNDGRWLVATGAVEENRNYRTHYALMAPEDFLAGNAKYTEVKPYELSE